MTNPLPILGHVPWPKHAGHGTKQNSGNSDIM